MATSGSTDYAKTVRDVIDSAFHTLGVYAIGDTVSSEDAAFGQDQLNLMVKTWGASDDPKLWLMTEGSQALTQSVASYNISAARRVTSVRRRTSSVDTPLVEWSRQEYFDQPTKSAEGTPSAYYFDPQRTARTLYIWNAPDAYAAANTTLQYTYLRVIEDLDDLSNDIDTPQEWTEALMVGLAARLTVPYRLHITNPQAAAEIKERAQLLYGALSSYDEEQASVFIQPA